MKEGGGGRGRTFGADAHFTLGVCLEETLDTTAGELFGGDMSAIYFISLTTGVKRVSAVLI